MTQADQEKALAILPWRHCTEFFTAQERAKAHKAIAAALSQARAEAYADAASVARERFRESPGSEGDEWRFAAEEIAEAFDAKAKEVGNG